MKLTNTGHGKIFTMHGLSSLKIHAKGKAFPFTTKKRKSVHSQLNKRKGGNSLVVFYFLMQIIPIVPTKYRCVSKQSISYL